TPGECVALVGDNGAGKSTLVKVLSGAIRPDEGVIHCAGEEVSFHSPLAARAAGIETVYQDLALADDLDAAGNVYLGREITWGLPFMRFPLRRKMASGTRRILERTGVHIRSHHTPVRQLSGGQRQGLAIARAIGWDARVVIMDEPTAALGMRETK